MNAFLLYSFLISAFIFSYHCHGDGEEREIHIVYMGEKIGGAVPASSVHYSMLQNVLGRSIQSTYKSSATARENLVYSYRRSFNAFAAKLTKDEVATFKEMEGVVSVIPNTVYQLHTTRSWDFMGMTNGRTFHNSSTEGDVIVGLIDTGIWPESPSFSDKDMGPPPARWKGTCQGTSHGPSNFTCNNKIIGARFYNSMGIDDPTEFQSPRDSFGHGTHTSSTAAGRRVDNTSYFGLASGTAHGAVPQARIAMYKVCWSGVGCPIADIFAAFDDAIADGVDVISFSIGGPPVPFFDDPIAIGAFHAMRNGIVTVCSAANSGPYPESVTNVAPWVVTVAASTIDRKFTAKVVLGDGRTFLGTSINRFESLGQEIPLVDGGATPNVSAAASDDISRYCYFDSLNSLKVENKIVLCGRNDLVSKFEQISSIIEAKGIGGIMASDSSRLDIARSLPLPATVISDAQAAEILDYIHSTSNPVATILAGETAYDLMAPRVASFSSRGPNPVDQNILKPDLTAPGVDILAAWSPSVDGTNYLIISGTSMSCPHVSGAAAYIKSVHPQWSPSAIKSALMTTAMPMDPLKHKDAEFAYGSGHIDPIKALNPGLVFDASEQDYVAFLCAQGYNETALKLVTNDSSIHCSSNVSSYSDNLNYPSFALAIPDGEPIWGVFYRTVTNVGAANSTYYAKVYSSSSTFTVDVTPSVLSFSSVGETQSFTVTVKGGVVWQQPILSGYVLWKDGTHEVKSPVVVYTVVARLRATDPKVSRSLGGSTFRDDTFRMDTY